MDKTRRIVAANVIMALVFAALVLLSLDSVRERILPSMYDDANSFSRIDPRPGWTDTGIVISADQPIGIIVSGAVSTPRLAHGPASGKIGADDVGPEGASVPEARIPDWRELDNFRAFALVGRVNGGKPFLVGRFVEIQTPGRLELKINCLMWDKTLVYEPGTIQPRRRKGPLTAREWMHLRSIRGFFAYRTWRLGQARPRPPRVPHSAADMMQKYGSPRGSW